MVQTKELPISGNLYFVHTISSRSKETGLYDPFLDGNINVTLNRLYNNINNFDNAIITLPYDPRLISEPILDKFLAYLNKTFNGKVDINVHDFYGSNIEQTRKNLMDPELQPGYVEKLRECILNFQSSNPSTDLNIICDFPILMAPDILEIGTVRYNYNWNKASEKDTSYSASLFPIEVELSRRFETYLYSDVQYNYWADYVNTHNINSIYFRSSQIFNTEFIEKTSDDLIWDNYLEFDFRTDRFNVNEFLIDQARAGRNILFYPSRIEDPRYSFDAVIEFARKNNDAVILTNPTQINKKEYEDKLKGLKVLDLSNSPNKRATYFYVLSQLGPLDKILRYETDMHISLIEQIVLSKCKIIHNFTESIINSYIK